MQLRDMHASGVVGIVGIWGCPEVQQPSDNHHIGRAAKVQKMPRIFCIQLGTPPAPTVSWLFQWEHGWKLWFFLGGDFPAMQKMIKNGVQQSHERRFIAGSTKQMVGFLPTL